MADAHKNFAYTTVATAPVPADSGTSLVVATGGGALFPATPFNVTIWPAGVQPLAANAEIVRVTDITVDTFTITRAQEESTARSITAGDQLAATITVKTLTDIETDYIAGPGSAVDSNFVMFDTASGHLAKDGGYNASSFDANGAAGAVQSNLTTHQGLTASVHNFDASGDAPAQVHGSTRHSGTIGAESQITFSTSGHEHTGTDSNIVNYGLSPNSTGTLIGNAITKNADPVYFDLAEGYQTFVDNTTDPLNPTRSVLYVGVQSHVTVTNLATWAGTYVGVNGSGTLIQQQTEFTPEQRRTISPLAFLFHANNVNIKSVLPMHHFAADAMARLNDAMHAIGIMNLEGNQYYANGANLDFNKSIGVSYAIGTNFQTSRTKPDTTADPAMAPVPSHPHSYRSTGDGWTQSTFQGMDTTYYDDASGTLAAIPSGKWVAIPLFYIPGISSDSTGGARTQYPQRYFDTKADALASVPDETFVRNPNLKNATIRTYCIVQQGATVLNSTTYAEFKQVGKFDGAVVGGGAGSGEANTLTSVGTAGVSIVSGKVGVDLQVKAPEAASSKISITDYPTNKTVRFDVAEANIVHQNVSGAGTNTHAQIDTHLGAAAPHSGHVQIGGQLGNTAASPDVRGIRETGGPTNLTFGAVADGQYLLRSGATVIGGTPGAGPGGLTLTTVEANLASIARYSGKFNITSSGLTTGRPVMIIKANGPYTGKGTRSDEAEMDAITVSGKTTSTTNIECFWQSDTAVRGNHKFDYAVG
jgi:hypothetical protein